MISRRFLMGGGGAFTAPPPGTPTVGSEVAIDTGSGYKGFPGLVKMATNETLLVYRDGSEHETPDDGVIKQRIKSGSWGAASTIIDPADDARDPSLCKVANDDILMSYFRYASGLGTDVYVVKSTDDAATWGTPVAVTHGYSVEVACSAPVVEVSPSLWLMPIYGRSGALFSASVVKSTDSGATWGDEVSIATGSSVHWTEPWIARLANGDLQCLIRVLSPKEIWRSVSTDDGATWSAPALAFAGDSRVATYVYGHGGMTCAYRKTAGQLVTRYSTDSGATFSAESASLTSTETEYAAITADLLVYSAEVSGTDADLFERSVSW